MIGTILFFYEKILHAKKILKKHISKYTLTNCSNKSLLFRFYAPYAYNYKLFYEDLHANIRRKKYISRYVLKTSKRDFTRKKKILKKHISKYTLTKHSNKRLLFTFYALYAYNYKLFCEDLHANI